MIGQRERGTGRRPDVYLHPAAHRDLGDFPRRLGRDVHLVVVPLTGSRRVGAAVLLDIGAGELLRMRRVLPDACLFLVTTGPASPEQVAAAQLTRTRLLPGATAEQVRDVLLAPPAGSGTPAAA